METFVDALNSAKSGEDIETAISSSSAAKFISDLDECSKISVIGALEKVLENETITTTAKLRRRIKRFQQSLDKDAAPEIESTVADAPIPAEIRRHLSPDDSIAALVACKSYHDLTREMNNLCLPGDEEGGIKSESFAKYRCPMKCTLQRLLSTEGMTNKVLRRRVSRLIFVLSTDVEQAQEIAAAKAKAAMATIRNLTAKKVRPLTTDNQMNVTSSSSSATLPTLVHVLSKFEAAKYIAECISGIRSAKTPADVERVISALPSSGFGDSETLRDLLHSILENDELVNNAKLRRRVKRLIETLMASGSTLKAVPAVVNTGDLDVSNLPEKLKEVHTLVTAVQKDKPPPLRIPSTAAAVAVPVPPPERIITGSYPASLKLLFIASSSSSVEEAISDLCVESEGDDESRKAVRERLEVLFKDEVIVNNSKLRRRIKRLLEMLAPVSIASASLAEVSRERSPSMPASDTAIKKEKKVRVKKEDLKNPPSGPSLEVAIAQAVSAKSSEELSSALTEVNEQSGTCSSRRTLKRILERAMKGESDLSGSMTAQTRRKLRRVADILSPRPPPPCNAIVPTIGAET
jgi:predicted transcriptional regulator